nr:putative prib protein [Thecaphora frezii]
MSLTTPPCDLVSGGAPAPSLPKASPLAALADGETPAKRGSNLACLKCRAIKVRCSRAQPTDLRCKRCNRLDLSCEYKEHHRGRKPKKRPRIGPAEDEQQAQQQQQKQEPQKSDSHRVHANLAQAPNQAGAAAGRQCKGRHTTSQQPESPSQSLATTPHPGEQCSDDALDDETRGSSQHQRVPRPGRHIHGQFIGPYFEAILNPETTSAKHRGVGQSSPAPTDASPNPNFTQHSYASTHQGLHRDTQQGTSDTSTSSHVPLNPYRNGPAAAHATPLASDSDQDAIGQRVITLQEAEELFTYYFAELNPPLALLDPQLHTVQYCRRHRSLLFSAIVAASSKFCRPDIHPQCQRISKSALAQAAAEETCSLDHIQALILVITWKDPADRAIDRKLRRAIGYAYELGLVLSFDEFRDETEGRNDDEKSTVTAPATSQTGTCPTPETVGSATFILGRREQRDRQRTWIMLCLVQAVLHKGDRYHPPLPRQIPLQLHPDAVTWYHRGGDLALTIDARLAWSLEMVALTIEVDDLVDLTTQNPNPTSFGVLFDTFWQRAQMIRRRWFRIEDGQYRARYPMDESAVAELPYLDAHRQMFLSELHWHWACKVAAFNDKNMRANRNTSAAAATFFAQPAVCFARTAELALKTLQLFVRNIVNPGYLRVGHDYLVICASQAAKWLFLYRNSLDDMTLQSAYATLLEIVRECSRPQYLPNGEPTNIEREAPGYLVRYVEALLNAGLTDAVQGLSARRLRAPRQTGGHELLAQGDAQAERRNFQASTTSIHPPRLLGRERLVRQSAHESGHNYRTPSRQGFSPPLVSLAPDRATPVMRASSERFTTPGARADVSGGPRIPPVFSTNSSPSAPVPYDRNHGHSTSQLPASTGNGEPSAFVASPVPSSPSTASSLNAAATHPAYFAHQSYQPLHHPGQRPSANNLIRSFESVGPSPEVAQQMPAFPPPHHTSQLGSQLPIAASADRRFATNLLEQPPCLPLASDPGQNFPVPMPSNVAPLPADSGKASLGSLVSNLGAQDLDYWENILGSDLSTFN